MKTRVIHTRFWKDSYIRKLTAGEKLVFNYLLTNEKVNIIHCYEIDIDEIVFDLGLSASTVREALKKLQSDKKISFRNGWVFLGNAAKYESYKGIKNDAARKRLLQEMSKSTLDWYNNLIDRGIIGVYIPPINHKPEIINKSKEGVVRGRTSLEEITSGDISEIATEYHVPEAFVISKIDDVRNYCASHGKKYLDYKAALRSWVKSDAVKIVQGNRKEVKSLDASKILHSKSGEGGSEAERRGVYALEKGIT